MNEQVEGPVQSEKEVTKSRKDLHLPRRFFHLTMGLSCGLIYKHYLTHQEAVHILGIATCIIYIVEQIRIKYPEFKNVFTELSKYLLRAEEQLKESATIPFLMGMLLTILTFPKYMTLVAIFTLAVSDPFSAIIGILFGKTKIKENRSLEGCAAFFFSTLIIHLMVLSPLYESILTLGLISVLSSFIIAWFDYLELKIDDNLTIPITTASALWILTSLLH
jgi:diacylglycerol kinase (CTP)